MVDMSRERRVCVVNAEEVVKKSSGIVDPSKVQRTALEQQVPVARLMATTN